MAPSLNSESKKKLDEFLKSRVDDGRTPALIAGVTTADEEIYFGTYGDRNLGSPQDGPVGSDTSE